MRQILSRIQKLVGLVILGALLSFPAQAKITISGISSGGFMASQMGTIYSSQISGVATVAGGFFYCAQNHLQEKIEEGQNNIFVGTRNLFFFEPSSEFFLDAIMGKIFTHLHPGQNWLIPSEKNPTYQAVSICMRNPMAASFPNLKNFENEGLIDKVENMKNQRVYIYQGYADKVVHPLMAKRLVDYYVDNQVPKSQIKLKTGPGGHNFPTAKPGLNDCLNQEVPYVSSCKFNLAEDMLTHLLNKTLKSKKIDFSRLHLVDQNLVPVNETLPQQDWKSPASSLGAYGYLYSSKKCLEFPQSCDLHVALHGCEMSDSFDPEMDERYSKQVVQTRILSLLEKKEQDLSVLKSRPVNQERQLSYGALKFAALSGYIELAEKNDLMILFPQTWISSANYPYNPKGCWDWFGANNSNYATNKGIETSWLIKYIREVSSSPKKFILSVKPSLKNLNN